MREIHVRNVNKTFGENQVLKNVSVDIPAGQITGIVGRNGSGKTVLLKCIIGLMRPDSGEITVGGTKIGQDVDFAPNLGFIIETPGFIGNRTGFQNLKYLSLISGRADDKAIRSSIKRVGLNPSERKKVANYSLGMRQRLAADEGNGRGSEIEKHRIYRLSGRYVTSVSKSIYTVSYFTDGRVGTVSY